MQNDNQIIIDVREPSEFADGHVEGAINIPSGNIVSGEAIDTIREYAQGSRIVLYCRTGIRAGNCVAALDQAGLTGVVNGINQQNVQQMLRNAT